MSGRHQPLNGADSQRAHRDHVNLLAMESRIRTGIRPPLCRTPIGRFMDRVRFADSGCWEWTAEISSTGYPRWSIHSERFYAHRYSCEIFNGPIPDGYHVDHLCRNTICVNPDHLEAVPPRVNSFERGKTDYHQPYRDGKCRRGHAMTPENVYVRPDGHGRMCRTCQAFRYQRSKAA